MKKPIINYIFLGGIFGLFIGASLFSFIEVFSLLGSFGLIVINHLRKSSKRGKVSYKK